ncbi:hypothetical protein GGR57DRAFT_112665 [Xylariaceae sp. FL1272]|nr:hypothetical protein GGR57DRAFT_112665 [Xylariaceae sp. FL1272]
MSSAVAELEAGLNAMQNLKPPGVSGSRINSLTALCISNVQSESVLIQKIYTHFKKAPATHKLGVLYVVDSVTRKWVDQAKQHNQPINSSAQDGTYAAGVHRVTELLPVLMNDIIQNAPGEQKEKIKKLVDIWEKGQTFPLAMIESFKQKLNAPAPAVASTTPAGSPPPGPGLPGLADGKPSAAEASNAIMEALANIARQNVSAAPASNSVPPAANPYSRPPAQQPVHLPITQSQSPAVASTPFSAPQPLNAPYQYPPQPQPQPQVPAHSQAFMPPVTASNQPPAYPGYTPNAQPQTPAPAPVAAGLDPNVQQQVMLIKLLADQGVPVDKIPMIIAGIQNQNNAAPPASAPQYPPQTQIQPGQQPYGNSWGQDGFRPDESRERNFSQVRSPPRYHDRSRSRSPPRQWDQRDAARGRDLGGYGHNSPGGGRMDDRDRRGRGSEYRQRSPPGRRGRSPTPPQNFTQPGGPKWVDFDRTVPAGHIKVLSRTLFVGGVTCSDAELRSIFNRHGEVQTCIVNTDKRHAFVKMVTRRDAVAAKEAMQSGSYRTRWGVGFGPRDCSDYQTGISIIPISKLTEADRKWMLTADYGGSGGRPIETGMVVEEPDIEIGAGVSSKAISRRMQTDKGGRHGPKSSRGGDEDDFGGRWQNKRNFQQDNHHTETIPGQLEVEQLPFGITTGPNGMPIFPPGFTFPGPN